VGKPLLIARACIVGIIYKLKLVENIELYRFSNVDKRKIYSERISPKFASTALS
jgi:hypothetical protein